MLPAQPGKLDVVDHNMLLCKCRKKKGRKGFQRSSFWILQRPWEDKKSRLLTLLSHLCRFHSCFPAAVGCTNPGSTCGTTQAINGSPDEWVPLHNCQCCCFPPPSPLLCVCFATCSVPAGMGGGGEGFLSAELPASQHHPSRAISCPAKYNVYRAAFSAFSFPGAVKGNSPPSINLVRAAAAPLRVEGQSECRCSSQPSGW